MAKLTWRRARVGLCLLLGALGLAAPARADETIRILYNLRPPYVRQTPNGELRGLTADPVRCALAESGVAASWELTPTKRQMESLREALTPLCLLGWFKTPEREALGTYSPPIYQDRPMVAIARANNDKLASGATIAEIFDDKRLTLLVKEGFSYGRELDDKIREFGPNVVFTLQENLGMLEMIHAGRADYMLCAPEEAESLIEEAKLQLRDFKLISFADRLEGPKRHLLCNKRVSDEFMSRLGAAIQACLARPAADSGQNQSTERN